MAIFIWALSAACVMAQTSISLASTMDGASYVSEDAATGSFGRIDLGDGTRPVAPGDPGDGDAAYNLAEFNDPNPTQFGSDIDLFPRESDFLVGSVEFDETLLTGSGVEVVQIDAIDLSEFWTSDPNRSSIDPASIITDFSDKGIGLYFFELPGDLTFGPLDSADTVTFTDGVLTSIDLEISAQFNIDTSGFGGAGLTTWDGTFTISGNQLSYSVLDTEPVGFAGDSTFDIQLTGTVDAVGTFSPLPGTLAFSSASYSVDEDSGMLTVTVERSGGTAGAASVAYATKSGSASASEDFETTIGTLNWTDGDGAPKTFDVPILNDETFEGDESFTVSLGGATGAAPGDPSTATVTVVEDDRNPDLVTIELAGPATGFVAIDNFKNSSTRNGIEGKDGDGNFNPNHNGLPDYPNFQIPEGFTNGGVWTAVIGAPQSAESDYASVFSSLFYDDNPLTVNNLEITQPDFDSLSAGIIEYDGSLVAPTGMTTIPVSDITFDFNTFAWDGNITPEQTGDPRSNFDAPYADPDNPIMISTFSPVYTPYNDGSGSGNAQVFYQISISSVTGTGLTFTDGVLTAMDLQGDVLVQAFVAPFVTFGSLDYSGTFNASGLGYEFDVSGTSSLAFFSNVNLVMNRAGGVRPPNSVAVVASVDGSNGTVSCDPEFVLAGGSATCVAMPDAGFKVEAWTGDCASAGTAEVCSLSDIQTDQTSTVSFTELQQGTLALSEASYSIVEDGVSLTVTVTRSGGSDGAASVAYATLDGSATAPADYTATSGTLEWAEGDEAAKTFDIPIFNDGLFEGEESFTIDLNTAVGAALGSPASATVTIVDNDPNPAIKRIDLAGPATGFIAIQNLKNSSTRNGIEGKDEEGNFDPDHNGLPEYPNFQIPEGFTNGGVWSAVIGAPQSTESDYASTFSTRFFDNTPLTVNNQEITQPDFDTLSAGVIEYDSSLVPLSGTVTIPVEDLSFNLNTFAWDGNITPDQTGDPRSNFDAPYADPDSPIMISNLSPVFTPYNDGAGAGNAQLFYQISLSNMTGGGLTFTDGMLTDADLQAEVTVEAFVAPFFGFGPAAFTGTLDVSGLTYEFDVSGTRSLSIFSGLNLIMNRSGTLNPPSDQIFSDRFED